MFAGFSIARLTILEFWYDFEEYRAFYNTGREGSVVRVLLVARYLHELSGFAPKMTAEVEVD